MKFVQIEVANLCNAKCIFCPRDKIESFGTMTMESFVSLVYEIKRKYAEIQEIVFSGFGEPFINYGFIDKLYYAREQWPNIRFVVYSNGSLIRPHHYKAMELIGNVFLNISLNGPDRKTRRDLMGLDDWNIIIGSLGRYDIEHRVSMVAHPVVGQVTLQRFLDMFKERARLVQFQSWAGLMYEYHGPTLGGCFRIADWATFNWQGKQIKCCYDVNWGADCSQCTEEVNI